MIWLARFRTIGTWTLIFGLAVAILVQLNRPAPKQDPIRAVGGRAYQDVNEAGQPVVAVSLAGREVTDKVLETLQRYPALQRLHLPSSRVTSGGLAHLQGLSELRELDLGNSLVNDGGLVFLKGLKHLRRLL